MAPNRARGAQRGARTALALLATALLGETGPHAASAADEVVLPIPEGVLPPEIPQDNPLTQAKIDLGRRLYFDKRLSADDSVACATCHDPAHGFADGRGAKTSAGVGGALGQRNSPTTLNAAFLSSQFWDGRAATLEAQAVLPIINPIEMAMPDHPAVVAKLAGIAEYAQPFTAAFGDKSVTIERVGQALASFERTLIGLNAPIDRFLAGQNDAISEPARRGWELFNGKARCNTCHGHVGAFPLFTDDLFHNIGVGAQRPGFEVLARQLLAEPKRLEGNTDLLVGEVGRFAVTREGGDMGRFKTSQLRNIALTAPYMHDGSEATLLEVIEYYDSGGQVNPWLDGGMRALGLTEQERADLVELLESFTSDDIARLQKIGPAQP